MAERARLADPLTDGEIEEAFERWSQFATTPEDWVVVRALGELSRRRERDLEERARQWQRDAVAQASACDEDCDGYGNFVGVAG